MIIFNVYEKNVNYGPLQYFVLNSAYLVFNASMNADFEQYGKMHIIADTKVVEKFNYTGIKYQYR